MQIFPFDKSTAELQAKAHEFCQRELILPKGESEWNLANYAKAWIAVEGDAVVGVSAFMFRADIAVFRSVSDKATTRMHHRLHAYFADLGLLGQDVFIQFSDADKQKLCAGWQKEFERAELRPANRFLVRVKPV